MSFDISGRASASQSTVAGFFAGGSASKKGGYCASNESGHACNVSQFSLRNTGSHQARCTLEDF